MTIDFKTATATELTNYYNALSGKKVKPTSYSKAKLIELIKSLEAEQKAKGKKARKTRPAPTVSLVDLLIDPAEFDPESDDFMTLAEVCKRTGLKAKTARARIRRQLIDDKVYTKYYFKADTFDQVIKALG